MKRIKKEYANDDGWTRWVQPIKRNYIMACCDCGLVHRMDFRICRGRVQFRAQRATEYTRRQRMKMRPKTYTDSAGRTIAVGPATPKSSKIIRETAKRASAFLKKLAKK